jgi:hypothetical protein
MWWSMPLFTGRLLQNYGIINQKKSRLNIQMSKKYLDRIPAKKKSQR